MRRRGTRSRNGRSYPDVGSGVVDAEESAVANAINEEDDACSSQENEDGVRDHALKASLDDIVGDDFCEWSWGGILEKNSGLLVELSNTEMSDADLVPLFQTVGKILERRGLKRGSANKDYFLNVDLSCNPLISDDGVVKHLLPFLESWPMCRRLKLYKTSIGDRALEALTSWVAGGHAQELHLSDLKSQVSVGVIGKLLECLRKEEQYPYIGGNGTMCPLWLRLEHNGIGDTEKLVRKAKGQGLLLEVVAKKDLGWIRPGASRNAWYGGKVPAVQLVLFHEQEVRALRARKDWQDESYTAQEKERWPSSANGSASRGDSTSDVSTALHSGAEEEWRAQYTMGLEIVSSCPTNGDSTIVANWREYLEHASEPESEARRILNMCSVLCQEGFYGGSVPPSSSSDVLYAASLDVTKSDVYSPQIAEAERSGPFDVEDDDSARLLALLTAHLKDEESPQTEAARALECHLSEGRREMALLKIEQGQSHNTGRTIGAAEAWMPVTKKGRNKISQ